MDRTYETFLGGATKPSQSKINVTISPQNVIAMNANCYRLLGKPEAVKLAFSREQHTIAIVPCSPRFNEAFPVKPKSTSGWRIQAAPFCRHFGIKIDTTIGFRDAYKDEHGALLLDLRKVANAAYNGPKQKKKAASRV